MTDAAIELPKLDLTGEILSPDKWPIPYRFHDTAPLVDGAGGSVVSPWIDLRPSDSPDFRAGVRLAAPKIGREIECGVAFESITGTPTFTAIDLRVESLAIGTGSGSSTVTAIRLETIDLMALLSGIAAGGGFSSVFEISHRFVRFSLVWTGAAVTATTLVMGMYVACDPALLPRDFRNVKKAPQ